MRHIPPPEVLSLFRYILKVASSFFSYRFCLILSYRSHVGFTSKIHFFSLQTASLHTKISSKKPMKGVQHYGKRYLETGDCHLSRPCRYGLLRHNGAEKYHHRSMDRHCQQRPCHDLRFHPSEPPFLQYHQGNGRICHQSGYGTAGVCLRFLRRAQRQRFG